MAHGRLTAVGGGSITLSGALSITSATSPVTSSTRTITGTGTLQFSSIATDQGTPQYSKNAAAYVTITEGLTVSVTTSDTIAVKALLGTVGFTASFVLKNNGTGATIENVSLIRS